MHTLRFGMKERQTIRSACTSKTKKKIFLLTLKLNSVDLNFPLSTIAIFLFDEVNKYHTKVLLLDF